MSEDKKLVLDYSEFLPEEEPATKEKTRYELLTSADFVADQPPILWTVDGLISEGSTNIFFGDAGCGKTWALLDLAACVAVGAPWLGMATTAGAVLIVDEESGRRRLSRRMNEVMKGHEIGAEAPIMAVSLEGFDLGNDEDVAELRALIIRKNIHMVIVDALAEVMPGKQENEVKDTAPIMRALRGIAEETQAAIIVIHHSNKQGGYRGSGVIKASVDLLLSVEKKNEGKVINFKTEKARDTTAGVFAAEMNFIDGKFFLSESEFEKTAQAYSKGERFVMRYLLANGESSLKDISDNADTCAATTARDAVRALADKFITTRTNGGGKGVEARYNLTEKGRITAEAE